MKVTSIASTLPGWYDPAVDGFVAPKSWKGARVWITVPIEKDPASEMSAARRRAEKSYPGATLHMVPDFQRMSLAVAGAEVTDRDDESLLRSYLAQLQLPEGVDADRVSQFLQLFLPAIGAFGVQGLHFDKVVATNVLCFASVVLELDKKGVTLVSGVNKDWADHSNGAGKSALVSTPFIALFGRTFKNQTHDEWARQSVYTPAVVSLGTHLPDGRKFDVVRSRRPPSLRVWIDDKEETMADANKTQALIEQVTGLTWEVLTNSVYIGQREIGSVFGTDKERKELFSRLLGLDRFLDAQEKIRKVSLRRRELVYECELDMAAADTAFDEASRGTAEIMAELAALPIVDEKVRQTREYDAAAKRAKLAENKLSSDALFEELEANQRVFGKSMCAQQDAETRMEGIEDQIRICVKLEAECPTCGSKVSVKALEHYVRKLKKLLEAAELEADTHAEACRRNRDVRKALQEKVQALRHEDVRLSAEIQLMDQEASKARELMDARFRLEAMLKSKTERVDVLRRKRNLHAAARRACVDEQWFADFCVKIIGRDGLPAYLCSVAAPALNQAAVRYSEVFTEGEIGLTFSKDLDVKIMNLHGGASVKDQSAGEMRMAAIIAALSFRDALVRHNLIVLDEPSDGLDSSNAAAFARSMNAVAERFEHAIVISHSEALLAELEPDYRITVTKENRVASIVTS